MSKHFNLPDDPDHLGLLKKLQRKKGEILIGRDAVKGPGGKKFPPDDEVRTAYIFHDQIRGFYKPKGSKYILSYLSTGAYNSGSSPIKWVDEEKGLFQEIEMWPPNAKNDNRASSDIAAARKCLEDAVPIGLFVQLAKGKVKCLGLGLITGEKTNGVFIVEPVELETEKQIEHPSRKYFAFKTNKNSIEMASPNGSQEFIFGGIYTNSKITKKGDIVFFVQYGDNPSWDVGLSAICQITKEPFDKGYDEQKPKNFKVTLEPLLVLPRVVSKKDLIGYFNCYDIIFIGPMTKGEPNQANNLMTITEAKYLSGALIDIFGIENKIKEIFGSNFPIPVKKAIVPEIQTGKFQTKPSENLPKLPPPILPRNLIIYGAPGTGKSYELNSRVIKSFNHPELNSRVTFHSSYTYKNFIGSYKPKPLYKSSDNVVFGSDRITERDALEPMIEYVFEPGPMLVMLCKAIKNPESNFVLVIEEINRANTASVFGDFFQLLDRDDNGQSQYPITLEESAADFLAGQEIDPNNLKIPANLFLWATMNNADQGVLPLDTAFKRRWSFEHLGLNDFENIKSKENVSLPFLGTDEKILWNKFREVINNHLIALNIHEDKLIGPFFLSNNELKDRQLFKNKLLLYLKEDVLRYKSGIFRNDLKTFSMIAKTYDQGENIFDDNIDFNE